MGLETLLYVALAGFGGAVAGGALSGSTSKPKFPPVSTPKPPTAKPKSVTEASMAFLAARRRRGSSRASSRITMPGFLDPAQTERPTLSSVLG